MSGGTGSSGSSTGYPMVPSAFPYGYSNLSDWQQPNQIVSGYSSSGPLGAESPPNLPYYGGGMLGRGDLSTPQGLSSLWNWNPSNTQNIWNQPGQTPAAGQQAQTRFPFTQQGAQQLWQGLTPPANMANTYGGSPGFQTLQGQNIAQWDPIGQNAFGAPIYNSEGPLPSTVGNGPLPSYQDFMSQLSRNPAEQAAFANNPIWAGTAFGGSNYISPAYDPATNSLGGNLAQQQGLANWNMATASGNPAPTPAAGANWTPQNTFSNGMQNTSWWNTDPFGNQWMIGSGGLANYWPGGDPNAAAVNAQAQALGNAMQGSVLDMGPAPSAKQAFAGNTNVANPFLNLSYNPMSGNYYFPTPGGQVADPGYSYLGSGDTAQTVAPGTPGATTIPASISNVSIANDPSRPGQPQMGPGGSFQAGGQTIDPALLYRARLAAGIYNNGPPTYANSVQMPQGMALPGTYGAAYGQGLPGPYGTIGAGPPGAQPFNASTGMPL